MNLKQEQLLVKKAQNGNRAALAELWDALTPKLFGYLINTVRNHTLAEDLLQSTWLHAIEALPRFRQLPNTKFSAWLFAIARNECKQHWRHAQREHAYIETQSETITDESPGWNNNLMVDQALHELSEDDRELIRLRYIADLPINDIARILNLNFVTVQVRLHRALNKIRSNFNSLPNHE